ncbi:MAG: DUF1232 domain-containing protein [Hyphomicrobiaceae bacterium]|nr:DUF1232 domain-containing protein [Hyphomicrobiaceae bacterium]
MSDKSQTFDPEREALEAEIATEEVKVRKDFFATLRKAAGAIPFADELVAAYYCALDRQTPLRVRAALLGALAYFVLPLDAVPDFLALVGFSDDAAVLLGVLGMMRAHISDDHRKAARQALLMDENAAA